MTLEQYSYIAQILGLLFIIPSLIYVGRQLKQNTEMMRAESRNSIQQNHQQEILELAHYPEIWRGFTGEELSDENVRVNLWLTSSLRSREFEWIQFQNDALDENSWNAFSKAIPLVLSTQRTRAWWDATKLIYDSEFVVVVDSILSTENFHDIHLRQAAALASTEDEV